MLVNVHEAKTRLSQLLAAAEAGEEVVIARNGEPSVRLVPVVKAPRRAPGFAAGPLVVSDDFDAPVGAFDDALADPAA